MTQDEILKILQKSQRWMLVGEFISMIHISRVAVNQSLKSLFKQGEVMKRPYPRKRGGVTTEWKVLDTKNVLAG